MNILMDVVTAKSLLLSFTIWYADVNPNLAPTKSTVIILSTINAVDIVVQSTPHFKLSTFSGYNLIYPPIRYTVHNQPVKSKVSLIINVERNVKYINKTASIN